MTVENNIYLSINQVAERLGVSRATINRWRASGDFPKARQLSPGCVRWRLADIVEWEESLATCFATKFDWAPTHEDDDIALANSTGSEAA